MKTEQLIQQKIKDNSAEIARLHRDNILLQQQNKYAQKETTIKKWLGHPFESSSFLTAEFSAFARDFKKHIQRNLPSGAELISFNRGHFYCSGFIKREGHYVYFSTDDVRGSDGWYENLLIRTAKNDKDYTGGSNQTTDLPRFTENVMRLLRRNEQ